MLTPEEFLNHSGPFEYGTLGLAPILAGGSPPSEDLLRILIIEDEDDTASALAFVFQNRDSLPIAPLVMSARGVKCWVLSHATAGAANVLDAVRALRPHLITVGLNLPGVNGLDLIAILKSRPDAAGLPILVVSATTSGEELEKALALGADDFVRQPVEPKELITRARTVLWKRGNRASTA